MSILDFCIYVEIFSKIIICFQNFAWAFITSSASYFVMIFFITTNPSFCFCLKFHNTKHQVFHFLFYFNIHKNSSSFTMWRCYIFSFMTLCLQFESNKFLDFFFIFFFWLCFGVFCFLLYLILLLGESKKFSKLGEFTFSFVVQLIKKFWLWYCVSWKFGALHLQWLYALVHLWQHLALEVSFTSLLLCSILFSFFFLFKKMLHTMVKKIMNQHVISNLISTTIIFVSFDLCMFHDNMNIFIQVINEWNLGCACILLWGCLKWTKRLAIHDYTIPIFSRKVWFVTLGNHICKQWVH